jgi:hypothetical protein
MVARLLLAAAFAIVATQAHAGSMCPRQQQAAVVASAEAPTEATTAEAVVPPDETATGVKTAQAVE